MRCDLHCPAPASSLRGPLLALGAVAALALAVYVASLLEGFLVALLVAVAVLDAAGIAVFWRRVLRPRSAAGRPSGRLPRSLDRATARPVAQRTPLALPAARPAVEGVVLAQDAESRLPA